MNKQETMAVAFGILHEVIIYIQQNPYLQVIVTEQCPFSANNNPGSKALRLLIIDREQCPYCRRTFLIYFFLRIAGVSYGRFKAMRCKLICQRIFRTVGDW
jgi:hypothetical protein